MHRYTLYLCTHIHLHTCILCLYICMPPHPQTHMHARTLQLQYIHSHTHTFIHVHYIYACIHIHTCTCIHIYAPTHTHAYTYIHPHIYMYTYRHTHTRALSQFLSCCYSRTSDQNSQGRKGLLDFWVTAHHCGKSERKLKRRSRRNTAYGLIFRLVLLAFLRRQAHLPKDGASHVNHVSRPCGW